jgi:hypothetical protein
VKLTASGIEDGTLKQVDNQLRNLAKQADFFNPEEVKTAVANYKSNRTKKPVENSYKTKKNKDNFSNYYTPRKCRSSVLHPFYNSAFKFSNFLNQEIWASSVDTQRYS